MNKTIYCIMSVFAALAMTLSSFYNVGASSNSSPQLAVITYYISAAGSDTNNCTQQTTPCKSFNKAQSLAKAGDTIHIIGTIPSIRVTKDGIIVEGGVVDGIANKTQDSPALGVSANNVTIRNIEVVNGWSYGIRTSAGYSYLTFDNVTIHNSVLENKLSTGGCNTSSTNGWGSGFRAYYSTNVVMRNSKIYDNCGEGFSSVMSSNVTGTSLEVYDNFSVNIYPDQSQNFTVTDSVISCIKPAYQRSGISTTLLLGAENYSGMTTNTTNNVTFERNKIYNCKGVRAYSETTNDWKNIRVVNNEFYNVPSPAIASIPGINIVTSPNVISSVPSGTTPVPTFITAPTNTKLPAAPTNQPPTGQNVTEVRVAAGNDDVEESASGWMYLDSTDLELVYDSNNQIIGLRFKGVNVPKGATITNAYISFAVDETTSSAANLSIRGEASPNATGFTTANRNVSSRLKTTNAASWSPASWLILGANQQTSNLAPIIQEIINQSGWVSGNSMVMIFSGNGSRVAQAYETNSAKAPLLHIEYSVTTSAANIATMTATPIPVGSSTASPTIASTSVALISVPTSTPISVSTQIPTNLPSATATAAAPSSTPIASTEIPQSTEVQPSSTEIMYDNTDTGFIYSPDWVDITDGSAYNGSYKKTNKNGAFVTFTFTGQSFSILHTGGSSFRNMDVYVDDVLVGTINERIDTKTYQVRWDYSGQLTPGSHTLKLVFVARKGTNKGSLDAVIIR